MAPHSTESEDWQVNYSEIKMRSAHLWRSREWADCSFRFETDTGDEGPTVETTVEAHKLILAMSSPVFAAMFYGSVGDKEEPVLISDIELDIFKRMMDYIYSDEVVITSAEVATSLYRAANKYFLLHLEKKCIEYLYDKLDTNNVCHIYEFSCLYNEVNLKQKCLEMIFTSTRDVLKGFSFINAQVETLYTIYSMDNLNINSELELLDALVSYTEAQPQEVEIEPNLLQLDQNEAIQETNDQSTTGCSSDEDKAYAKKRERVANAVKEIRFLTLLPHEFAEFQKLPVLLSESEIYALSMNISSAKTYIPMPAGFSTSRMPRNKSSVTKSGPPTDEEITKCVKEILDKSDLEVVTMKTVVCEVYERFSHFDLKHKKEFIKKIIRESI